MIVDLIRDYMPWALSAGIIYMEILKGSMRRRAWVVGFGVQAGYLIWMLTAHEYGFLISNIVLWVVYVRGYLLWKKMTPIVVSTDPTTEYLRRLNREIRQK